MRLATPILMAVGYGPPRIRERLDGDGKKTFYVSIHGRLIVGRFLVG